MTKDEIKVLAACHRWFRNCADKDSTDALWKAVQKMLAPRKNARSKVGKPIVKVSKKER